MRSSNALMCEQGMNAEPPSEYKGLCLCHEETKKLRRSHNTSQLQTTLNQLSQQLYFNLLKPRNHIAVNPCSQNSQCLVCHHPTTSHSPHLANQTLQNPTRQSLNRPSKSKHPRVVAPSPVQVVLQSRAVPTLLKAPRVAARRETISLQSFRRIA